MVKVGEVVQLAAAALTAPEGMVWDSASQSWEPREALEKRAQAESRLARLEAFRESGCRVADHVLDAFENGSSADTASVLAVRSWWKERTTPWLVLSGPPGCGKSVAAARLLYKLGYGSYARADELVRTFASMFGEQYERQEQLRNASVLVLDDIGGELDATRMLPALLDLLDARPSVRNTATIVTTNLSAIAFRERYANARLMSRMSELVRWEAVGGDDLRRKKA